MISFNKKVVNINGKKVSFSYHIENVLEFDNVYIVHLMEDHIPDNNIIAIDEEGNIIWKISDIIHLPHAESYISLSKENNKEISAISYNGIKSIIDIYSKCIVEKHITK